jgi:hypothetical protein
MGEASDDQRQSIERIMRKAESLGLDPARVASALQRGAAAPTEYQTVQALRPRSRFKRSFTRGLGKLAERRRN